MNMEIRLNSDFVIIQNNIAYCIIIFVLLLVIEDVLNNRDRNIEGGQGLINLYLKK